MDDDHYRKSVADATHDEMTRDPERDKPAQSSAMVIVLGLVALLSLVIGFILGKIF